MLLLSIQVSIQYFVFFLKKNIVHAYKPLKIIQDCYNLKRNEKKKKNSTKINLNKSQQNVVFQIW